jgi:hypothetical protein
LDATVRPEPGKSDEASNRGQIYYGATAALKHARDLVFKAQEGALGIYGHNSIKILFRLFGDRGDLAFDASIVAGAIELPIGVDGACDQSFNFCGTRHVGSRKNSIPTILSDKRNGFVSSTTINVGDNNFGAFLGEFPRSSATNSGTRTRHQRHFPSHKTAHFASLSLAKQHNVSDETGSGQTNHASHSSKHSLGTEFNVRFTPESGHQTSR